MTSQNTCMNLTPIDSADIAVDLSLNRIQTSANWANSFDQTLFDSQGKRELAELSKRFETAIQKIWIGVKCRAEEGRSQMSIERVVIPHKYREKRRAVHIPAKRIIQFEMWKCGEWVVDYTSHELEAHSEYFHEFYGSTGTVANRSGKVGRQSPKGELVCNEKAY